MLSIIARNLNDSAKRRSKAQYLDNHFHSMDMVLSTLRGRVLRLSDVAMAMIGLCGRCCVMMAIAVAASLILLEFVLVLVVVWLLLVYLFCGYVLSTKYQYATWQQTYVPFSHLQN